MAAVWKRVQASNIPANTRTLIYTVPTGKVAILKSLSQASDAGTANMGTTIFNGNGFVWNQQNIQPYESKLWPLSTVIPAGEQIHAEHSATQCYTLLSLVELDAADAVNLHRMNFLSIHTGAVAIANPTGKRFRVRELVIANHGNPAEVSVYIPSVGHPVKARCLAGEGATVVPTDFMVDNGQTLHAVALNSAVCHVFASGTLEDV